MILQRNVLWYEGISAIEVRTTPLNVWPRREARVHPTQTKVLLGQVQRHPAYLGTLKNLLT